MPTLCISKKKYCKSSISGITQVCIEGLCRGYEQRKTGKKVPPVRYNLGPLAFQSDSPLSELTW